MTYMNLLTPGYFLRTFPGHHVVPSQLTRQDLETLETTSQTVKKVTLVT